MAYKTDLAFPRPTMEPPREAFVEYLKEQHQLFLEANQNLEHKVQLLQKSTMHLQARIKLKDCELLQKAELVNTQASQLEELKQATCQLTSKNRGLKKQTLKFESQIRQLEQELEEQKSMSNQLQNERMALLDRVQSSRSVESLTESDYLRLKNLELEKEAIQLRTNAHKWKVQAEDKQAEIADLHIILHKLSQEMQIKNSTQDQLRMQNDALHRKNAALIGKVDSIDTIKSKTVKTVVPLNQSNTSVTNRNKSISMEFSQIRKAGGIRTRNANDQSNSYESIQVGMSRDRENRVENIKKEDLLENLIQRFQQLKHGSLTSPSV